MKRIYVAGPYSGRDETKMHGGLLGNIGAGIRVCAEVLKMGYSPFVPWFDYQFCFFEDFDLETMYAHSMAWLDVSDALLITGDWGFSPGTLKEIEHAKKLNIPTYFSLEELQREMPA